MNNNDNRTGWSHSRTPNAVSEPPSPHLWTILPSMGVTVLVPTHLLPPWCEYLLTLNQRVAEIYPTHIMTIHFQGWHAAASLCHRIGTKITSTCDCNCGFQFDLLEILSLKNYSKSLAHWFNQSAIVVRFLFSAQRPQLEAFMECLIGDEAMYLKKVKFQELPCFTSRPIYLLMSHLVRII